MSGEVFGNIEVVLFGCLSRLCVAGCWILDVIVTWMLSNVDIG